MDFLKKFLSFTSESEVHPTHAMWSGLVALSSLIGKRVKLPYGHFDIYPNLYVIFVAPPGRRKGTAMNFAEHMVNQVKGPQPPTNGFTKEGLIEALQEATIAFTPKNGQPSFAYTPYTIFASELASLIGPSKDQMVEFLTDIYDRVGDWGVRTVRHGAQTITNPYLVLLACTNPDWITEKLKSSIITGGFSRRCIYVYETERPRRVCFPEPTDTMRSDWDAAVKYGKSLQQVYGEFSWAPDAKDFYENWYNTRVIPTDLNTAFYHENKFMQLCKVAMLLSLARDPSLVIQLEDLHFGLELLEVSERNLPRIFEHLGRNELKSVAMHIYDCVKSVGYMTERVVLNTMFAFGAERELMEALDHLCHTEKLELVKVTTGRATIKYYCTPEGSKKLASDVNLAKTRLNLPPLPPVQQNGNS